MTISAASGWIAFVLLPLGALSGCVLRRIGGRHALRMRPHYVVGYTSAALAAAHAWTSTDTMGGSDGRGITFAALALAVILVQAFLGVSLQAPGAFRLLLRRWHNVTFVAAVALVAVHVALNGSTGAMVTAFLTPR